MLTIVQESVHGLPRLAGLDVALYYQDTRGHASRGPFLKALHRICYVEALLSTQARSRGLPGGG